VHNQREEGENTPSLSLNVRPVAFGEALRGKLQFVHSAGAAGPQKQESPPLGGGLLFFLPQTGGCPV